MGEHWRSARQATSKEIKRCPNTEYSCNGRPDWVHGSHGSQKAHDSPKFHRVDYCSDFSVGEIRWDFAQPPVAPDGERNRGCYANYHHGDTEPSHG